MKSLVQLLIVLSGAYCIAMFGIATWSMFSIYALNHNQYHDDAGVLYCQYYLLISLIISIVSLALQCAIIWGKFTARMGSGMIIASLAVIILFYLISIFSFGFVNSDVYTQVVNSTVFYVLLMIGNSVLVMFAIWRGVVE